MREHLPHGAKLAIMQKGVPLLLGSFNVAPHGLDLTNVNDPSQARLVVFGETHYNPKLQAEQAEFIRRYARDGDLLMMEGRVFRVRLRRADLSEPLQHIPPGVDATGWEKPGLYNFSLGLTHVMELADIPGLTSYALAQRIGTTALGLATSELTGAVIANQLWRAWDYPVLYKRNEVLRQNIRTAIDALPPGNRVFVVAGRAHLTQDPKMMDFIRQYPHHVRLQEVPPGTRAMNFVTTWVPMVIFPAGALVAAIPAVGRRLGLQNADQIRACKNAVFQLLHTRH